MHFETLDQESEKPETSLVPSILWNTHGQDSGFHDIQ